jgi:FMN reductase
VKVVGLGGSTGEGSTSLAALSVALDAARQAGADVELFAIGELDLPLYGPGKAPTADVLRLIEAVGSADALVWSSPLYHGTISGAFKNALDWLQLLSDRTPAYLTDKAVGLMTEGNSGTLIATAGGVQGLQAINTMEFVVRALRGWTVPLTVPVSRAWAVFDEAGKPTDPQVSDQLEALGREVVRAGERLATSAPVAA